MDLFEARIRELEKILEYHNNLYYNNDSPEISDMEYDKLLRELENLEKEFPEYKSEKSQSKARSIAQIAPPRLRRIISFLKTGHFVTFLFVSSSTKFVLILICK